MQSPPATVLPSADRATAPCTCAENSKVCKTFPVLASHTLIAPNSTFPAVAEAAIVVPFLEETTCQNCSVSSSSFSNSARIRWTLPFFRSHKTTEPAWVSARGAPFQKHDRHGFAVIAVSQRIHPLARLHDFGAVLAGIGVLLGRLRVQRLLLLRQRWF